MTRFTGFSSEFLAPYYEKGDCFPSLIARSTYLSKYCRGDETWTDTIKRVVVGNIALDPVHTTQSEAEQLFDLFWNMNALPPGRGLWTGGVDGIPADARFNCFSKDTRFWADGRIVSFNDVVGKQVTVIDATGKERLASVSSFGKQKLQRIRFGAPGRSKFSIEFVATPNHRWITDDRGTVDDLKVGDRVTVRPERNFHGSDFDDGFVHGVIFGDGSAETNGGFRVRLCGAKATMLPLLRDYIEKSSHLRLFSVSYPPSHDGDPLLRIGSDNHLKQLPTDEMSRAYQAGFLDGWIATDGSTRASGSGGNRLSSTDADAVKWLIERAPMIGYCVTGLITDSSTETNFGLRTSQVQVVTLSEKSVTYTVREIIDEGREEEVYCVTEPVTQSFTLAGGIYTRNCWFTTIRSIDDWCWVANQLMLGGGVGVGLQEIDKLPVVHDDLGWRLGIVCDESHSNVAEVMPDGQEDHFNGVTRVKDSREGWVDALKWTLECAFHGESIAFDVSDIRERGKPIKTFGGIACGPGPLVAMLRAVYKIVRGAAGRKLTSVEALDITNHIGLCIKSGNVRRSALIALGDYNDTEFRNAKKDASAIQSHRHTSNNSIAFKTEAEIANMDWAGLVEDNAVFGEPGILNLPLIRKTDPGAKGVNPCGEQALEDREACNLAEVFPARIDTLHGRVQALRLVTRYCIRQRLSTLSDPVSDAVGKKNMRIGVGLGGVCDFNWTIADLALFQSIVRLEADHYADTLKVSRPITCTTVKPSGTISLLNGSSPGLHAPFAPYYIRRVRIAKNDPMAGAMAEAGVPREECVYDSTHRTWVYTFPMSAPNARAYSTTETIRDQFERQVTVQHAYADNAVSATLSFTDAEKDELAKCLKEYVPHLKSTSCLPKSHGYAQAPYEEVTREEFERLSGLIDSKSKLTAGRGGELEIEECAGGVCPVR